MIEKEDENSGRGECNNLKSYKSTNKTTKSHNNIFTLLDENLSF